MIGKLITYLFLRILLLALFASVASPVFFGISYVHGFLAEHQAPIILRVAWGLVGLALFLGLLWAVHNTATQMTFGHKNLYNALRATIQDARLHLSFLPLIGNWFHSNDEERGPDRDWDED